MQNIQKIQNISRIYSFAKMKQNILTLAPWAAHELILLIPVLLISKGANVNTTLAMVACIFANENCCFLCSCKYNPTMYSIFFDEMRPNLRIIYFWWKLNRSIDLTLHLTFLRMDKVQWFMKPAVAFVQGCNGQHSVSRPLIKSAQLKPSLQVPLITYVL